MTRFFRTLFFVLILLLSLSALFLFGNQIAIPTEMSSYSLANKAYKSGDYPNALQLFKEALQTDYNLSKNDLLLSFKIGYALFKTEQYSKAEFAFRRSRTDLKMVEDYPLYFQSLCELQLGDTVKSLALQDTLRLKFPQSSLNELIDSLGADLAIQTARDNDARRLLEEMLKSGRFEKTEIYVQLIDLFQKNNNLVEFKKSALKFIKRYPFHNRSISIYDQLLKYYSQEIPAADFKTLVHYLFTTSQFRTATRLIQYQKQFIQKPDRREYLDWLNIEIFYRQNRFNKVLDWCLKKRKGVRSLKILREIDLHIARCYLRLGLVKKSIKAYLLFQKRYPTDQLSPEVLWKVAWLYEGLNNLPKAIQSYKILVGHYRKNDFRNEALFRIGLNYYRLQNFGLARQSWQDALGVIQREIDRARVQYWIGKSYEKQKNYQEQGLIYIDLAKRPVDSFYNLKAFYLTSNGGDTHKSINEIFWQLHHRRYSYLPGHISDYRRTLIVNELLGERWSDQEIKKVRTDVNNWPEVFAQGELHERMGDYGRAYRKFRSIFNAHFSESNLPEMIPIFKKLYPFYFTPEVDSASQRFSVPPALILSVIKKESAFEPVIISYANAYGLMQLLPSTAAHLAPRLKLNYKSTKQLFEPQTNITIGSYFLSTLLKRYRGNLIMALGAYNAGPHRMDRWRRIYPTKDDDLFMENLEFEQTRVYVRTILKYYWIYKTLMNPGEIPEEILAYPINLLDYL